MTLREIGLLLAMGFLYLAASATEPRPTTDPTQVSRELALTGLATWYDDGGTVYYGCDLRGVRQDRGGPRDSTLPALPRVTGGANETLERATRCCDAAADAPPSRCGSTGGLSSSRVHVCLLWRDTGSIPDSGPPERGWCNSPAKGDAGWFIPVEQDAARLGNVRAALPLLELPSSRDDARSLPASISLTGYATWYEDPRKSGLYGAAGPVLRRALGDWRGQRVTVCHDGCVTVVLRDWCVCGPRAGEPTLVDLSPAAFRELAPLSAGVIEVSIPLDLRPKVTLPPTDTAGG